MSKKVNEVPTITSADVGEVPAEIVRPAKSPRSDALKRELEAERDKLQAELAPYREDYERLANNPRLIECRLHIKRINALLMPIMNDLAALVRAGGSKGIQAEAGSYSAEGGQ